MPDRIAAKQAFGARLRLAIAQVGADYEQGLVILAKVTRATPTDVQGWLEGSTVPCATLIPSIARELRVDRYWLQTGSGVMPGNWGKG